MPILRHRQSFEFWDKFAFPSKFDVLYPIYICLCLIRRFCRWTFSRGVIHRFPSWADGTRCVSITSLKSNQILFFLLPENVSTLLIMLFVFTYGIEVCVAKISKRKFSGVVYIRLTHRFVIWLVEVLHYRRNLYSLDFLAEAYQFLLGFHFAFSSLVLTYKLAPFYVSLCCLFQRHWFWCIWNC